MYEIFIYNTLTRREERFIPVTSGNVKMYVCGPTPQDYSHIGHGRTYVAFDVIRRFFEYAGYNVLYVQNITDIEDKIINKAKSEGVSWKEISNRYTEAFLKDLDTLNIKRPHIQPKVTEHIDEIIEFITVLIEKGFAYEAEGNVYFDVDKFKEYGKLSRVKRERMIAEEVGRGKRKPYDFALWKAAKPGEPWWESPWGKGRPGWHIECSVMSSKYLGSQFDIHGGATDLIFPHHENEIAQSEARFGVHPWVRYWMHTGLLYIEGEKMSKSLGNIIPIHKAVEKYGAMPLRYYFITTHYRSIINFTDEGIKNAISSYNRLKRTFENLITLYKTLDPSYKSDEKTLNKLNVILRIKQNFLEAMSRDFNTPKAIAALHELAGLVRREIIPEPEFSVVSKALETLGEFNRVLGLFDDIFTPMTINEALVNELVALILEVRQRHRSIKNYEMADWIANKLRSLGFELEDYKDKTIWRRKSS